ncbi:unnamed protein product [Symbiodinium natans]|uniref:Uncharacterized protein n=1 Tax=Symbiodinium natans TaxID=878477 RepID=A0A812NNX8_9DINO|nr:unnamed protein product [Symbiodinium natans]
MARVLLLVLLAALSHWTCAGPASDAEGPGRTNDDMDGFNMSVLAFVLEEELGGGTGSNMSIPAEQSSSSQGCTSSTPHPELIQQLLQQVNHQHQIHMEQLAVQHQQHIQQLTQMHQQQLHALQQQHQQHLQALQVQHHHEVTQLVADMQQQHQQHLQALLAWWGYW